jgi:hypothetical protein
MGWGHIQHTANEARRHAQYAWERAKHVARRVDDAVTHAAQTAVHVAKHVDKVAQVARPVYGAVRPLIHPSVRAPLDQVAATYDTIRRSI